MSPTESELRAALRDGEGDGVDAGRIIAAGLATRARRRHALLVAAAVVVVAGASAGAGALWSGGGSGSSSAEKAGAGAAAASQGAGSAAGGVAGPRHPGASTTVEAPVSMAGGALGAASAARGIACPASPPHYLLPGTPIAGSAGAAGPLFARPVAAAVVCAYGAAGPALGSQPANDSGRLVLVGARAQQLATSLESASRTRSVLPCPAERSTGTVRLAIIGVDAQGRRLATVTAPLTAPPCNGVVTNGTAARYQWAPPADLAAELRALVPQ